MNSIPESKIEELVREKLNGKSYSDLREELAKSGMSPDKIRALIRQVDEEVLVETRKKEGPGEAKLWYRFGLILAVIGLILSIAYNAGIVLQSFPALLIYSPFLAGILLMFNGRAMQKKQQAPKEKGTGAIRKKRPYT
jgi:hypothetical protein